MRSKLIIASLMVCVLNLSVYSQIDKSNSFQELESLAQQHFENSNLDSAILVVEYARSKFHEHDEDLTITLHSLYLENKQDTKVLENWNYGLNKRYFFGIREWQYKQFENNKEFKRLVEIDQQIGDSLSTIAHVQYEVVLPNNYSQDKEYPLLFVFHGNNRNLPKAKSIWTSSVVQNKFIAVYLQSHIYMSRNTYQWQLDDEKTNKEFKEIFDRVITKYPVNKDKVLLLGMSAGGRQAINYAFSEFVPIYGLVLNCPVIPEIPDSSISKFVKANKRIAIITGENDWALADQEALINKVGGVGGNSNKTINPEIGHEFPSEFSNMLDEYLKWML